MNTQPEQWEDMIHALYAQIIQCHIDSTKKGYQKKSDSGKVLLKEFISQILKTQHKQTLEMVRKLLDFECLSYCREQNGIDHCKNCGLSEELLDNLEQEI